MPKLILTKGLPGSGKTTWAREHIQKNKRTRRVNRDDIRRMFGPYDDFSNGREQAVTLTEEAAVKALVDHGYDVIVDDCNLNPQYVQRWGAVAEMLNLRFELQDFSDVPLRECLKRNAQRTGDARVGNKVVHEMYKKWLAPEQPEPVAGDKAIICDLDGTLAIIGNRSPYDASTCDTTDRLNEAVAKVVRKFARDGYRLIFMTGREAKHEEPTRRFLRQHGFGNESDTRMAYMLYMRDTRDTRPDHVVKKELYERYIKENFNVEFCLDDRDQIVDMWRSIGLVCFQVGEGWF